MQQNDSPTSPTQKKQRSNKKRKDTKHYVQIRYLGSNSNLSNKMSSVQFAQLVDPALSVAIYLLPKELKDIP